MAIFALRLPHVTEVTRNARELGDVDDNTNEDVVVGVGGVGIVLRGPDAERAAAEGDGDRKRRDDDDEERDKWYKEVADARMDL